MISPVSAAMLLVMFTACAHGMEYKTDPLLRNPLPHGTLRVHIVPHTHDDAGWLKTFDQYYWGLRQDIQQAGVQYILDGIVESLAANPNRRFTFAEVGFFSRWWAQQDEDTRARVVLLVSQGRLEFVNGGYVQHDEAAAHYVGMLDQTTRGHRFLAETFGVAPTIGWQLDPFGHSETQAGLFGSSLGFDALFFGRADYQDMEVRKGQREMEMVWQGSGGGEAAGGIFTGNFASGNYGPPPGFWWEYGLNADPIVADDPGMGEYNVEERVETFVQRCLEVANVTRGKDLMLTMGSDFHYGNAQVWFKNLDKLIHYANEDGRIHAFYSTPSNYVAAKHAYNDTWPLKDGSDFFPYADTPHSYWTGYFTSRPTSKGYIRAATAFLQAARQLEAFVGISVSGPTTDALEEAVSLLQHHDAITGTAKQHVANDYNQRIHSGMKQAQDVVSSALSRILSGEYARKDGAGDVDASMSKRHWDVRGHHEEADVDLQAASRSLQRESAVNAQPSTAVQLELCDWLNISSCAPTVHLSRQGESTLVVAYNSLGWARTAPVRVPMQSAKSCSWQVYGPDGETVEAQVLVVLQRTLALQDMLSGINATDADEAADIEVVFLADLPPLGYSSYELRPTEPGFESTVGAGHGKAAEAGGTLGPGKSGHAAKGSSEDHIVVDNGAVTLTFDRGTGLMVAAAVRGGPAIDLATTFAWYNSSDGMEASEDRGQSSSAYIFRPNGVYALDSDYATGPKKSAVQLEVVRGEVVTEVRQVFAEWATLVTRLYNSQPYIEVEWTVGPVPFEDGLGREVVVRYTSDIQSGDAFFTDANGRAMVERRRNARPTWDLNVTEPVAGNYYPLTAAMFIEDEAAQLAVLTDRAQGGTSLRSGELEIMVHRRTAVDDGRGVGEPLNETACGCLNCACPGLVARGIHWLVLSSADDAARQRRLLQQLLNDPPVLAFGAVPQGTDGGHIGIEEVAVKLQRSWSMTNGRVLHASCHLLTLMRTAPHRLLVRLAHIFQDGENAASPFTEDISELVEVLGCSEPAVELSLSGNQCRSDSEARRRHFHTNDLLGKADSVPLTLDAAARPAISWNASIFHVELSPMEVRTFELHC